MACPKPPSGGFTPGTFTAFRRLTQRFPVLRHRIQYYAGGRGILPPGAASVQLPGPAGGQFGMQPYPMNVIQSGEPNTRIRERYNITDPAPVPTLSPELLPVVLVDDLTTAQKQTDTKWCRDGQPVAMVNAGNRGAAAIHNPAGSGIMAQLRHVDLNPSALLYGTPTSVIWGVYAGLPTIVANFAAEFANKYNAGFPMCRFYNGASTSGFAAMGHAYVGNGIPVSPQVSEIVLPPGFTFECQQVDNTGGAVMNLAMTFSWTESPERR